MSKATK
jgi:hypothetical protein